MLAGHSGQSMEVGAGVRLGDSEADLQGAVGELGDAAAAPAVFGRHAHPEVAELARFGPQLVGVLAGFRLAHVVLVAVALAERGHRLAEQQVFGSGIEVHANANQSGVRTASRVPASTCEPACTRRSLTVPAAGACTACSSFIASTVNSRSPAATRCPGTTMTRPIEPGSGATSEPSGCSAAGSGNRGSSVSATEPSGPSTKDLVPTWRTAKATRTPAMSSTTLSGAVLTMDTGGCSSAPEASRAAPRTDQVASAAVRSRR